MIQKIVKKHRLQDRAATQDDLAYWLSKTPEERVATVDYLRRQYYGNAARLQRVVTLFNAHHVEYMVAAGMRSPFMAPRVSPKIWTSSSNRIRPMPDAFWQLSRPLASPQWA